jgi:hypothetical protein
MYHRCKNKHVPDSGLSFPHRLWWTESPADGCCSSIELPWLSPIRPHRLRGARHLPQDDPASCGVQPLRSVLAPCAWQRPKVSSLPFTCLRKGRLETCALPPRGVRP